MENNNQLNNYLDTIESCVNLNLAEERITKDCLNSIAEGYRKLLIEKLNGKPAFKEHIDDRVNDFVNQRITILK